MDDLFDEAVSVIIQYDRVSASLLQRRLAIGYARAARIIDQLESLKLISPNDGSSKPREVLIKSNEEYKKIKGNDNKQEEVIKEPVKDDYEPTKPRLTPDEIEIGTKNFKFSEIGNLIVTGNVISKKFVFLDNYINSILENYRLPETKLIIYDSFGILKKYDSVPHLLTPVVTNDLFISALRWTAREVDRRIDLFNNSGCKNINEYCKMCGFLSLPRVILIINSCLFDIEETESIKRISSIGTLQGIHMIIINDSVKDIPRQIRDNIPARLEFNKFGENKAIFVFKEKSEIEIAKVTDKEVKGYLNKLL